VKTKPEAREWALTIASMRGSKKKRPISVRIELA